MIYYRMSVPKLMAESLTLAIKETPIKHPDYPDLVSVDASTGETTGDYIDVVVIYPRRVPLKSDIPTLISSWHSKPTPATHKALWEALWDGSPSHSHDHAGMWYTAVFGGQVITVS